MNNHELQHLLSENETIGIKENYTMMNVFPVCALTSFVSYTSIFTDTPLKTFFPVTSTLVAASLFRDESAAFVESRRLNSVGLGLRRTGL